MSVVHFSPEWVVHFHPEYSLVHFHPELLVHFSPEYTDVDIKNGLAGGRTNIDSYMETNGMKPVVGSVFTSVYHQVSSPLFMDG